MKIHLIGIGGSGLSAIALFLRERGHEVSGSDLLPSSQGAKLAQAGVRIYQGHQADQVHGMELVIRSSAVPDENPEVVEAVRIGIPVKKRTEFLGELTADSLLIAVAGTHGKTTTTAMIAWLLTALNQDPSFIIGGTSENLQTNARAGAGRIFVIEADEYDNMFLGLNPDLALVTNVEYDHPDLFANEASYFAAFAEFTRRIKAGGRLVACSDDFGAARLAVNAKNSGVRTATYGISGSPDFLGEIQRELSNGGSVFDFRQGEDLFARVAVQLPGVHTVQNAVGALAVIDLLDFSVVEAAQAMRDFRGTQRRFQIRGTAAGVTVVDDYAHHPTEIRTTINAARSYFPGRRLWALWQPHTYSRTQAFFDDFTSAFEEAHRVIVTEVFASRENIAERFSSREIVAAMDHPSAFYAADFEEAKSYLHQNLEQGDVLLILSAGDANIIGLELLETLDRPGSSAASPGSAVYRFSSIHNDYSELLRDEC